MAALTGSTIAVDAAFAIHGTEVIYTPDGGDAQTVAAILRGGNPMADLLQGGAVREAPYMLVRVSDLAAPQERAAVHVTDGAFAGDYSTGGPVPHGSGLCHVIPLNPPLPDDEEA